MALKNAVVLGMLAITTQAPTTITDIVHNSTPVTATVTAQTPTPQSSPQQSANNAVEYIVEEVPVDQATPAARQAAPRSGGTGSSIPGVPDDVVQRFDKLSECESGGNWSINTGNGYFGGIQFSQSSWVGAGGTQYAPRADLATREQQIKTGYELQKMQGWGAWPSCSAKYGYI